MWRDAAVVACCLLAFLFFHYHLHLSPGFGGHGRFALLVLPAWLAFSRVGAADRLAPVWRGLLYLIALYLLVHYLKRLSGFLWGPIREWDFLAFYFDGYVARFQGALYRPESYYAAERALTGELSALGHALSADFRGEVFDPAFKNPPFTAFLFWPLSHFPIATANVLWRMVNFASILAFCAVLAHLMAGRAHRWLSQAHADRLALCAVILLSLYGTARIVSQSQTSAMIGVCLALVLVVRGRWPRAVWAAAAVIVKPIGVIGALLFLVTRDVRQVLALAAAGVVVLGLSLWAFGTGNWADYLAGTAIRRLPAWMYYQTVYSSLLPELVRWSGTDDYPWNTPWIMPVFYAAAAGLALPVLFVLLRYGRDEPGLSLSLLICLALVLYPGTQNSYQVLFAIPAICLLMQAEAGQAGAGRIGALGAGAGLAVLIGVLNAWPIPALVVTGAVIAWLLVTGPARRGG